MTRNETGAVQTRVTLPLIRTTLLVTAAATGSVWIWLGMLIWMNG